MSILTAEQFESLFPLATAWAEEQEARICAVGQSLSPAQISDARLAGVAHPEQVRLLAVPTIPAPQHPLLRAAGEATQLINPHSAGLTLRYGIFIRRELINDRRLVTHELVHTGQYERCGSIASFLRQYLSECFMIGYPAGPMEQEAIVTAERICDGSRPL